MYITVTTTPRARPTQEARITIQHDTVQLECLSQATYTFVPRACTINYMVLINTASTRGHAMLANIKKAVEYACSAIS